MVYDVTMISVKSVIYYKCLSGQTQWNHFCEDFAKIGSIYSTFFLSFQVTNFHKIRLSCHLTLLTFYRPTSTAIIIGELEFDK